MKGNKCTITWIDSSLAAPTLQIELEGLDEKERHSDRFRVGQRMTLELSEEIAGVFAGVASWEIMTSNRFEALNGIDLLMTLRRMKIYDDLEA